MNQPDLGLKITELRQLKGLTQEKLAEYCDVSARTIQRTPAPTAGAVSKAEKWNRARSRATA